jgi:hypothetical protein
LDYNERIIVMENNELYYKIHDEIQGRYDNGEITLMEANRADKAAYDKYANAETVDIIISKYHE